MKNKNIKLEIENLFKKETKKTKNAYLLVHSEKKGIKINIAEGFTGDLLANNQQPNYMASVGKLFTSTIISILYEKGELSFNDKINQYLDKELLKNLHIYKGKDYTDDIKIKHLLKQTSGLNDNFWPLLDKLIENPDYKITPREAIIWSKNNLKPKFPPGKKVNYTDTNYHLLGLIIENITGMQFHNVLFEYIFKPLNMKHSSMLHYSEPMEKPPYPMADFYYQEKRLNNLKGYANIDFTGGGVVAPTEDLLKFMKALVNYKLVSKDTLDKMLIDSSKFTFGIDYSYGVWQIKTVPILMPKLFNSWGAVGVTGAFMFYHPELDTYLIGNFNDFSYEKKGLRFMFKVIKKVSKLA